MSRFSALAWSICRSSSLFLHHHFLHYAHKRGREKRFLDELEVSSVFARSTSAYPEISMIGMDGNSARTEHARAIPSIIGI